MKTSIPTILSHLAWILGLYLWLGISFEFAGTPPVLTYSAATAFGEEYFTYERERFSSRDDCETSTPPEVFEADETARCLPCIYDPRCVKWMAWNLAPYCLMGSVALGIFSFLLLPFPRRSKPSYYLQVTLVALAGAFLLAPMELVLVPWAVLWIVLMRNRRFWYPIPADKDNEKNLAARVAR